MAHQASGAAATPSAPSMPREDEPIFTAAAAAAARETTPAAVPTPESNGDVTASPPQQQQQQQQQQQRQQREEGETEGNRGRETGDAAAVSDAFSDPGDGTDEMAEHLAAKQHRIHEGEAFSDVDSGDDHHHHRRHHRHHYGAEKAPPFCSWANLRCITVQAVCGILNGYPLGYVGVYTQLHTAGMDCARYAARGSCESAPFADCRWYTDGPAALPQYCGWNTHTCRVQYPNAALGGDDTTAHDACLQDHTCLWSHAANECTNPVGYSTAFSGIFAGSNLVGNMIGCLIASQLIAYLGVRLSLFISGAVGTIASVMCHIDIADDVFWVMNGARLVVGFSSGFVTVAAPLYVGQNAHPSHRRLIGSWFQTFATVGVLLEAIIGVGVGQSIRYNTEQDQNIVGRMQGVCAAQTMITVALLAVGLFVPHRPLSQAAATNQQQPLAVLAPSAVAAPAEVDGGAEGNHSSDDNLYGVELEHAEVATAPSEENPTSTPVSAVSPSTKAASGTTTAAGGREYTYLEMFPQILKSILLCATFRFTGFMAVANFGPIMMGSLGLAPLVGNLVIMVVNCAGALISTPVLRFVKPRPLVLFGTFFISCMLLFLCGVPVYPGVASESVTNAAGVAGIVLFILSYEIFIGPSFFVITQDLFPVSFRAKGTSIAQTWQYIFSLVVSICYPIAASNFSGGPQGNQHKGQAIVFIFFGGLGFILAILQIFFLHSYVEKDASSSGGGGGSSNTQAAEGGEEEGEGHAHEDEEHSHCDSDRSLCGRSKH